MRAPSEFFAGFLAAAQSRRVTFASATAHVCAWLVGATVLRSGLEPFLNGEVPFSLYLPGIVVVTAWCGVRAGLALTALSLVASWYLWLPPALSWQKSNPAAALSVIFWLLISVFMIGTIALLQRSTARGAMAANKLAENVRLLEIEAARREASERKMTEHARQLERLIVQRTAKLEETVAELEEFSYTVSHDLRSPARAMQGFAELLLEEYGDALDEQGREYLRRIDAGAQRMDLLIRDVLTYSRIGRAAMETRRIELEPLIAEAVFQNSPIKKIPAEIKIERPLVPVVGNPTALGQALSQILGNAVKFVPAGRQAKIKVWTEKRDSVVRVSIQDDGIGIPESAMQHIFKPFHRAHPQERYEGTGMGLAIVKRAIERQGGRIGVESSLGHGSTFWFELPAAPTHEESIAA